VWITQRAGRLPAVDAAAAEQRLVRSVDDRVDALRRDVAFDELDHRRRV
jgi:hypothetical protein